MFKLTMIAAAAALLLAVAAPAANADPIIVQPPSISESASEATSDGSPDSDDTQIPIPAGYDVWGVSGPRPPCPPLDEYYVAPPEPPGVLGPWNATCTIQTQLTPGSAHATPTLNASAPVSAPTPPSRPRSPSRRHARRHSRHVFAHD